MAMKKDRYESLPDGARAALAKHSGEVFARAHLKVDAQSQQARLKKLKDTSGHVVRGLTSDEQQEWKIAECAAIESWAKEDSRRQKVLNAVRSELKKLRGG